MGSRWRWHWLCIFTRSLRQIGKEGAAVGIGGLNNAFGFKLDTYHNTSTPKSDAKAKADPRNVGGGGALVPS